VESISRISKIVLTKQSFEAQNLAHPQQQWMWRIAGDVLPVEEIAEVRAATRLAAPISGSAVSSSIRANEKITCQKIFRG